MLGGGEFVAAFADRPEVQAFQTYLSTDTWANTKAQQPAPAAAGSAPTRASTPSNLTSARSTSSSATILQDPKAVFRFDGSDQMPAAVGSNAFWKQATSWITGQDTKDDGGQHRGGLAEVI